MGGNVRGTVRYLEWLSRIGILLVIAGTLVVCVGGLRAASEAGIGLVSVPITLDEMYLLLYGGGGMALGGAILSVLANMLADVVTTTQENANEVDIDDDRAVADRAPVSERHRRRLGRNYFTIGTFILLIVSLAARGDAIPGEVGRIATNVAEISLVVLFGSVDVAVVSAFVLFGLWYGIKRRSAEALLLGAVIAGLFVLSVIQYRAVGLTIAGLWLLYHSFMARKAVTFRFVEASSVPEQVRRYVG